MDIPTINRVIAALRNNTAWGLSDADLALIESDDTDLWPPPGPNFGEPWLAKYVPRVATEPGVSWSAIANAIRARRPKPVKTQAVIAVQPDPEADSVIATLQWEAEEAAAHLERVEAGRAKPSPTSSHKQASSPAGGEHPKTSVAPELTVTGKTISQAANDLRSLERGDGRLPSAKTFRAWLVRNGLDSLLEAKRSNSDRHGIRSRRSARLDFHKSMSSTGKFCSYVLTRVSYSAHSPTARKKFNVVLVSAKSSCKRAHGICEKGS